MGFRCPKCKKDFEMNKIKLDNHLYENPECGAIAYINLVKVDLLTGKKKPKNTKNKENRKQRKQYSHISENHIFRKTNIVSNDDGSDNVVCEKCGLKAKRYMNTLKFDGRTSHKKIENCVGK